MAGPSTPLLRQDLPKKGTDLSIYSQEELEEMANSLNLQPRKSLDVYAEGLKIPVAGLSTF
nr:hypothetical protein [Halomonas maris]